jgi:hypothetical protein
MALPQIEVYRQNAACYNGSLLISDLAAVFRDPRLPETSYAPAGPVIMIPKSKRLLKGV